MLKKNRKWFSMAFKGCGAMACLLVVAACNTATLDAAPTTPEEYTKHNDIALGASTYAPNAMIRSVYPWGQAVPCNTNFIAVSFNQPMLKSSLNLTIEPPINQGAYNLYANGTYLKVDLPSALVNGTQYKITIVGKTQTGADLVDVLNPWRFTVACSNMPG